MGLSVALPLEHLAIGKKAGALLEPNLAFNRTCHGRRLWPGAEALRAFSGTGPEPPAASRRLTLR
jgi:hypothetical protein